MDVSIIVPLYKGKRFINNILTVVKDLYEFTNKTLQCSVELILVNDFPDESLESMIPIHYCVPITLINNDKNSGIHYSRVQGLLQAKGKLILFFDQDDSLEPQFLYSQLTKMGDADAIVANGIFRNNRRIMNGDQDYYKITDREYYFSSLVEIISPGQVLIKRESIPQDWEVNIMKKNYCDDAFLWLLMKNENAKFEVNNELLYFHNEDGNNASFNWENTVSALAEMYKIIEDKHLLEEQLEEKLRNCIKDKIEKHESYRKIEEKFQIINQKKEKIKAIIEKNELKKIAIYGYGILGKKLDVFCREVNLEVLYAIDKNIKSLSEIEIKSMDEKWPVVDFIVVTAIYEYENIKETLNRKTDIRIISLCTFLEILIDKDNCNG